MTLKQFSLLSLALLTGMTVQGQTEWQDSRVNSVNRAPMHASYFAYPSSEEASAGVPEQSSSYMSLNGKWKFNWVAHAYERPEDFWKTDYNDLGWDEISVPGVWELNGYGDPIYVNIGYAWRSQYDNNPPFVPEENNHVGSYRRVVELPSGWEGKDIFVHFGSVTSNIYLWINGRYVGYSEDSKLEAEFEVSRYLRPGKNLIAFQVFRWCDGSYLEDQDFFRFSGVGRDCYMYAREKARISDIRVTPDLDSAYDDGTLYVDYSVSGNCDVRLSLEDASGRVVAEGGTSGKGKRIGTLC